MGCSVKGCDQPIRCKGLCRSHYDKDLWYRSPKFRERQSCSLSAIRLGTTINIIARLRKTFLACEVCGQPSKRTLHIDHSHVTGAIRGVLCQGCNHSIGGAKDNPAVLRALADYLETRANLDLREGLHCLPGRT